MAYWEQVGVNRQLGGKRGEIYRLYPLNNVTQHRTGRLSLSRAGMFVHPLPRLFSPQQGIRSPFSASRKTAERVSDTGRICKGKIGSNGKDYIARPGKKVIVQSKYLPDNPLDPVAADCAADEPVHTYPQAVARHPVRHEDQRKTLPPQPFSFLVNPRKLIWFPEKAFLGKPESFHQLMQPAASVLSPFCS